jgi:hypothetical protein
VLALFLGVSVLAESVMAGAPKRLDLEVYF